MKHSMKTELFRQRVAAMFDARAKAFRDAIQAFATGAKISYAKAEEAMPELALAAQIAADDAAEIRRMAIE